MKQRAGMYVVYNLRLKKNDYEKLLTFTDSSNTNKVNNKLQEK